MAVRKMKEICYNYCKYPEMMSLEDLDIVCSGCPLTTEVLVDPKDKCEDCLDCVPELELRKCNRNDLQKGE